jgi:AcrR family transcriptional regulator
MPRLTKSELDAEIIDRAAGLFARHGFEHTSLQQIADAVQYSKAGLLHYYPTKKAIYDKVLSTGLEQARALLASVEAMAIGIERDRAVVEASVQLSFDWPGVSAFASSLTVGEQSAKAELIEMGLLIYAALGIDMAALDLERIIRVTSAFTGMTAAAVIAARLDLKREWRGHIVAAAMDALGHRDENQAPLR